VEKSDIFSSCAYYINRRKHRTCQLGRFSHTSIFETCTFAVDKRTCSFGWEPVSFLLLLHTKHNQLRNDEEARAAHDYLRETLTMFSAELVPLTAHLPGLNVFDAVSRALTGLGAFSMPLISGCNVLLQHHSDQLRVAISDQDCVALSQDYEIHNISIGKFIMFAEYGSKPIVTQL